jgi:hypothetical protein
VIGQAQRHRALGSAGLGQVGDEAVGAALGDAQLGRDVAQPHPGSCAMHSSTRAWVVRKPQVVTPAGYQDLSSNSLLVFSCERGDEQKREDWVPGARALRAGGCAVSQPRRRLSGPRAMRTRARAWLARQHHSGRVKLA